MPAILTLNAGSSSIKAALFDTTPLQPRFRATIEGIGDTPHFEAKDAHGATLADEAAQGDPMAHVLDFAEAHLGGERLVAVGHRVVHGGNRTGPARVDAGLIAALDRLTPWAPLHQPQNLQAMRDVAQHRPGLPQMACFDTAFHHTLDPLAARYPIPRALHDSGLRRYGFHGLSYSFIAGRLASMAPALSRVIVAHLGSGASLCALRDGSSVDTTMGLTPLDGLMMGTRCGAVDPGLVLALLRDHDAAAVTDLLWHLSGLKGVSGMASDIRTLAESDSPAAREAIDLFVFRLAREAGGLAATLGGIDGLVFTGGIGEHDAALRAAACARLAYLGVALDPAATGMRISAAHSAVEVYVIPTDEEYVIASQTKELLS